MDGTIEYAIKFLRTVSTSMKQSFYIHFKKQNGSRMLIKISRGKISNWQNLLSSFELVLPKVAWTTGSVTVIFQKINTKIVYKNNCLSFHNPTSLDQKLLGKKNVLAPQCYSYGFCIIFKGYKTDIYISQALKCLKW